MKSNLLLLFLLSTSLLVSGQINFNHHNIIDAAYSIIPNRVESADLDGDGDLDLLVESTNFLPNYTLENEDGSGNFGAPKVVGTRGIPILSDLDGDGDLDLVIGENASGGGDVVWFENNGEGEYGTEQIISDNFDEIFSISTVDIDNDGDQDILVSTDVPNAPDGYYLIKNANGMGVFDAPQLIASGGYTPNIIGTDIDGDGDSDVVVSYESSQNPAKLVWYENVDGQGTFDEETIINSSVLSYPDIINGDLDGDGDEDIIAYSFGEGTISWYRNEAGNFGNELPITDDVQSITDVHLSDIDADGDMDIIASVYGDHKFVWYENLDGAGNFGSENIISLDEHEATSIFSGDFNGDGKIDIVGSSREKNKLAWFEGIDGQGSFGNEVVITQTTLRVSEVRPTDFDNDGDIDIIVDTGNDDRISWFENLDGSGEFSIRKELTNLGKNNKIEVGDIDGDGDVDVLAITRVPVGNLLTDLIVWYENVDSELSDFRAISEPLGSTYSTTLVVLDVDNDNDLDIVAAQGEDIGWYENLDSQGNFGLLQIIPTTAKYGLWLGDIDQDGFQDILSTTTGANSNLCWLRNDGQGAFEDLRIIADSIFVLHSVDTGDIDGDGGIDVIYSSSSDGKIVWCENTDAQGESFSERLIFESNLSVRKVSLGDLDGDGDLDAFSSTNGTSNSDTGQVFILENIDGNGNFRDSTIYSNDTRLVCEIDIDDDSDLDLVSFNSSIYWHENTSIVTKTTNHRREQMIDFTLFPVPTNGDIHIQSEVPILRIELFNLKGERLLVKENTSTVNISSLPAGILFCKILNQNMEWGVKKIIKK